MDGLGWDGLEVVTDSLPLWNSDLPNDIGDSFLMSNSNSSMYGCQMDLPDDILNPIRELQKAQPSCLNPDSKILQCQGVRSVAGTSHLKSANLGDVLTQELCSSPLISEAHGLSTSNASISDMEMAVQSQVINGSLDCLLLATNSNTDTSVEDDGISMIFSDCKNLWNLAVSSSAVSSGDSENNGSNATRINDEAVSQSYSDRYINGKESQAKPGYSKRCNDQNDDFKVGLNCGGYFNLLQTDISAIEGGIRLTADNLRPRAKKSRSEKRHCSSTINFQQPSSLASSSSIEEPDHPGTIDAQMKKIIYRAAVFRPVNLGLEVVEKPKRKNVRISSDPQTMAARQRRERISERIRVLQRLVPGGSNMDTASMLDEAANYLKFLRSQVKALENSGHKLNPINCPPTNLDFSSLSFYHSLPVQTHNFPLLNSNHIHR